MARAADNKDRWVLALDPAIGKTRVIASEHDDAWIDGPGAFTLGWMKDNQHIYFQSERTGYAQLYSISYDGGEAKPLTSGKWEVSGVQMYDDKSRFFLTTAPANDPNATATVKMLGHTPVSPMKGVKPTVEMADNGTVTVTQDDGQGRKIVMKFRSQSMTSDERGLDPRNLDLNLNGGKLKVKMQEAQPGH